MFTILLPMFSLVKSVLASVAAKYKNRWAEENSSIDSCSGTKIILVSKSLAEFILSKQQRIPVTKEIPHIKLRMCWKK